MLVSTTINLDFYTVRLYGWNTKKLLDLDKVNNQRKPHQNQNNHTT